VKALECTHEEASGLLLERLYLDGPSLVPLHPLVVFDFDVNEAAATCSKAAATLMHAIAKARDPRAETKWPQVLKGVLIDTGPFNQSRRAIAMVGLPANGNGLLCAFLLVSSTLEPPRCRLSTGELVELLNNPLGIGKARRVVLNALGARSKRSFADQWNFVRFAQEQNLGLDFTSPPRAP
jgi:hypothetical protein